MNKNGKESCRFCKEKGIKSCIHGSIAQSFRGNFCVNFLLSAGWYDSPLKSLCASCFTISFFIYNLLCFCPSSDTIFALNRENAAGVPEAGRVDC